MSNTIRISDAKRARIREAIAFAFEPGGDFYDLYVDGYAIAVTLTDTIAYILAEPEPATIGPNPTADVISDGFPGSHTVTEPDVDSK